MGKGKKIPGLEDDNSFMRERSVPSEEHEYYDIEEEEEDEEEDEEENEEERFSVHR